MQRARDYHLQPEIKVLSQDWQYPQEEERGLLKMAARRYVFSREVVISHQHLALMYARAVMPATMLTGSERQLRYLGGRALGSLLFTYPDMQRSVFEFKTYHLAEYSADPLWGRCSIFYFQEKALLLSEVFLPGLIEAITSSLHRRSAACPRDPETNPTSVSIPGSRDQVAGRQIGRSP